MTPRWFSIALGYRGLAELPGKGSNPIILQWAKRLGGWIKSFFTDDDIPWCALFVNNCLAEAGIAGTGSLAAKDFMKWGRTGSLALGAVLVFVRPGGHHVAFYEGERQRDGALRCFGGNQSNAVNSTWISKERLLGVRWPATEPLPDTGRVLLQDDGSPVSSNEG